MRTAFAAIFALVSMLATARAQDFYGAIAYSPSNGAYGYSYDYESRARAETEAVRSCAQHGSGCRVAIWFRNACGAIAVGQRGGYGTGWAGNRSGAEGTAVANCRTRDSGCRIRSWACTTR